MKKLVWSETDIAGGTKFNSRLAQPPSNEGPVRDSAAGSRPDAPHFYVDSAVIAYRTPADEVSMASLHPKVTTNDGPIDGAALLDDSLITFVTIAAPKDGGPALPAAVPVRSASIRRARFRSAAEAVFL